jgi:hypothetical protein
VVSLGEDSVFKEGVFGKGEFKSEAVFVFRDGLDRNIFQKFEGFIISFSDQFTNILVVFEGNEPEFRNSLNLKK